MAIDQRALISKWFGFLNVGTIFSKVAQMKSRRDRPFFFFEGTTYTYNDVYEQAQRYAKLFSLAREKRIEQGLMQPEDQVAIGLYLDNCPEFAFALFGAAICRANIIGINTGFRGATLYNLINQSESALLVTDATGLEEVERVLPDIQSVTRDEIILVGDKVIADSAGIKTIEAALTDSKVEAHIVPKPTLDNFSPLIVIYTSGTTGAPKGVPCSHMKLVGAAVLTWSRTRLNKKDTGYICMPMFHSNAWFIGILPLMLAGSNFLLKRKFSASAFEKDILEYGVSYMNYVGQPIHYILVALEKKYGSPDAVEAALAKNPKNRFRIAHGNGAPPVDRKKLIRYLDMEHVYELYGSTEAAISTCLMPGDPIESLGKVTSKKVVILNDDDQLCPPGEVDENGRLTNYEEAVGEICKVTEQDNIIFDGYYKNSEASSKKFRDGYYHSGDLGHVRMVKGKPYLYFNGRTDDWIRKDGENFSAESVIEHVIELPDVELASAYGAPCEVSDEKVMVSIQLRRGVEFKPQETYDWFMQQQQQGGMDPKWMPDYIRIVGDFDFTHQTQKILTRPLKRQHFNLDKFPEMKIFQRQRGDTTYHELTAEAFQDIKQKFVETGRDDLLYAGL